jgi:predicted transcriptional regulator of viral defense system
VTISSTAIGTLVLQMQGAFLDTPGFTLTVREAEGRFGADEATCQAILGLLADAGVLTRTKHGVYSRFFPLAAGHSRTSAA